MKTIKFTVLIALALSLSTSLMAQDSQQLTVPLSEPGKPFKIDVELISGSIKITVYDGKDIIIDAQPTFSKRDDRESKNGLRRISAGDNIDIIAHEKANQVNVTNNMPGKNISLTIKIPQGATSIKLGTINNGVITGDGISGDLEVNNTNGAIRLINVAGSVVANTTNGNVIVSMRSVDPKAAMAFTTLNGNVDVTFPASLKANIKARSDQGNVFSDFDMVTEKSPAKATKTAKEGMYRITVEDWVLGKINGGGPEILMKNMNGNIFIRKAK